MKNLYTTLSESILDTTTDDVERIAMVEEISKSLKCEGGTEISVWGKDIVIDSQTSDCLYLYIRKPFSKRIVNLFDRIVFKEHTNVYIECDLHFGKDFIGVWDTESTIRVMVQGDTTGLEITSPAKVWIGEDWSINLPETYQFKGKVQARECEITLKGLPFYPLNIDAKGVIFTHPDGGSWTKKRAMWRKEMLGVAWKNVYVKKLFPNIRNCKRITIEIGTISPQNAFPSQAQYFPKTENQSALVLVKDMNWPTSTKDGWGVEISTSKSGYSSGTEDGNFLAFLSDTDRRRLHL